MELCAQGLLSARPCRHTPVCSTYVIAASVTRLTIMWHLQLSLKLCLTKLLRWIQTTPCCHLSGGCCSASLTIPQDELRNLAEQNWKWSRML